MNDNFSEHWHGQLVGAFSANDVAYLKEQVEHFVAAFAKRLGVDDPKAIENTRMLVDVWLQQASPLSAEQSWAALYQLVFDHLEAVQIERNAPMTIPLNPDIECAPLYEQPTPEADVTISAHDVALAHKTLESFFQRRNHARTGIYRLVEKDPAKYRLLVALFWLMGASKFEAFIETYGGEKLTVPDPDELDCINRNREIVRLHNSGIQHEAIAAQFGMSAARVGQIVKAERSTGRTDLETTTALLREINRAHSALRQALDASELHSRLR